MYSSSSSDNRYFNLDFNPLSLSMYLYFFLQQLASCMDTVKDLLSENKVALAAPVDPKVMEAMAVLRPFRNNGDIMAFFVDDEGKPYRLGAMSLTLDRLAKCNNLRMEMYCKKIVQALFSREYILTHAWRVADTFGER